MKQLARDEKHTNINKELLVKLIDLSNGGPTEKSLMKRKQY